MGRPPRLPRKYCFMQLPSDINLRQLRLPADQMEAEIEKLDERGWNTRGEIRSNLYNRTSLICNMIREDILELELASLPIADIAIPENILSRSRASWNAFPAWIREMHDKRQLSFVEVHISHEVCKWRSYQNLADYYHLRFILISNTTNSCCIVQS